MAEGKVDLDAIELVRVLWSDLHGVARGKDVLPQAFGKIVEQGISFARASLLTDLGANPVHGPESTGSGWPDAVARPDVSTAIRVGDELVCVADVDDPGLSSRSVLRAQLNGLEGTPIVGPELEFSLLRPDPWRLYVERDTAGYVVGTANDPDGMLPLLLRTLAPLGAYAGNQEVGGGQFEINLDHTPALTAADNAFLMKHLVKEVAASKGLRATFMGRPFDGEAGNGLHIHLSLRGDNGVNLFDDPSAPYGLSRRALSFVAGVLAHAPALSAILNPTVNAYKRLGFGLAPISAYWGLDNRAAYIRIPPGRGESARLEVRIGDGAANPYLALAALLAAGADGVDCAMLPPEPVTTDNPAGGPPLPSSLGAALDALEQDKVLADRLGGGFVEAYLRLKRQELDRFAKAVTDWEFREYSWLL
ncbi:glutamine synthetase family protein [Actinocrispum sp. NPDC049592]|uniref:glutamine synthetase family protein n=1 Tax=Actinocrispum sp. NPDC049592 TaxID=3154835 RepID=UPI00342FAACA